MTYSVHPSSVVDPLAQIGEGTVIGPFCVIGPKVKIGKNCTLKSHIVMDCDVEMGDDNKVFPFVTFMIPQDLKFKNEDTKIRIGNGNTIREHVTIHCGTISDNGITIIGDNNLLMVGVHVAHDCVVGNGNVLANNATLAGHVKVGNHTVLGGLSAFHQFVQVGDYAIVGGMSPVEHDVIPYGLVKGDRARLAGLNHIGLERRGFEKEDVKSLMKAYKMIFSDGDKTFKERVEQASALYKGNDVVSYMIDFILKDRAQPLCQPK